MGSFNDGFITGMFVGIPLVISCVAIYLYINIIKKYGAGVIISKHDIGMQDMNSINKKEGTENGS